MRKYDVIRLMDLVESVGEDSVKEILSDFSCEYKKNLNNSEVENYLLSNAIEFSKRKMSITYLVMDDKGRVAGYFTLTHKPIIIPESVLKSNNARKKMQRHAKYDEALRAYSVSAFLIAQFSKNYSIPKDERISGVELMDKTLSVIENVQQLIGGGIVFLECEDHPQLIEFYTMMPNSFFPFGERLSDLEDVKYVQLMRFL